MGYRNSTAPLRGFLTGYKLVSPQPGRRDVWERELIGPDGLVICDKVIITDARATQDVELGNHFHPKGCAENFQVMTGLATVYVVPDGLNEELGYCYELRPGDELTVAGLDAHTFVCAPGTILSVVTNWRFVEGVSIVPRKIDLSRVPLPIPTNA